MEVSNFEDSVEDIIAQSSQHVSLSPNLEVKVVEVQNTDTLTDLHGVGAYCTSSDFVQITFDTQHPDYPDKSFQAAKIALFHEIHWQKVSQPIILIIFQFGAIYRGNRKGGHGDEPHPLFHLYYILQNGFIYKFLHILKKAIHKISISQNLFHGFAGGEFGVSSCYS